MTEDQRTLLRQVFPARHLQVEESVLLELILCSIGSCIGSLSISSHTDSEEQRYEKVFYKFHKLLF